MFALKCLCCEHDNPVGEKFCEQCGSTLNLKLCEHCEAINESSAQRCHKCDANFPAQPAVDQSVSAQTALGPEVRITDADAFSTGPRPLYLSAHQAVVSPGERSAGGPARASRTVVLSALLLAAIAGLAYYIYREPTLVLYAMDIVRRSLVEADRRSTAVSGVIVTAGAEGAEASTGGATQPPPPAEDAQQPVEHAQQPVEHAQQPVEHAQQPVERPPDQPRVNVRQVQPGAQRKPCEELKSEIEAKLKSKGVIRYSLDVVTPTDVKDGKVVGSCDGGTKKIVYKRG